mmetsp:Transcript_28285/g.27221  ORF Transcript_28285/g.27221 Transcript_28285/m.27221 type:complete len:335 (-) Transcript_28285:359-1363(-)
MGIWLDVPWLVYVLMVEPRGLQDKLQLFDFLALLIDDGAEFELDLVPDLDFLGDQLLEIVELLLLLEPLLGDILHEVVEALLFLLFLGLELLGSGPELLLEGLDPFIFLLDGEDGLLEELLARRDLHLVQLELQLLVLYYHLQSLQSVHRHQLLLVLHLQHNVGTVETKSFVQKRVLGGHLVPPLGSLRLSLVHQLRTIHGIVALQLLPLLLQFGLQVLNFLQVVAADHFCERPFYLFVVLLHLDELEVLVLALRMERLVLLEEADEFSLDLLFECADFVLEVVEGVEFELLLHVPDPHGVSLFELVEDFLKEDLIVLQDFLQGQLSEQHPMLL